MWALNKNLLFLSSLILLCNLTYSMEADRDFEDWDEFIFVSDDGDSAETIVLDIPKESDEVLNELPLSYGIIKYIMSFLKSDDPAYNYLQLCANRKLSENQIYLILYEFYKKGLESNNSVPLTEIFKTKIDKLDPSFPHYEKLLQACNDFKIEIDLAVKNFNDTLEALKVHLDEKDFEQFDMLVRESVKLAINVNDSDDCKNLSKEKKRVNQIIWLNELYRITKKLNTQTVQIRGYDNAEFAIHGAKCLIMLFCLLKVICDDTFIPGSGFLVLGLLGIPAIYIQMQNSDISQFKGRVLQLLRSRQRDINKIIGGLELELFEQ